MTSPSPTLALTAGVAAGGALGALARWGVGEVLVVHSTFPWATFAINVVGSLLLALLPVLVADSLWWRTTLGPGLLGGFTTMSAAAEQTRALLDAHHLIAAFAYCGGTVVAALAAVAVVQRWAHPAKETA